MLPKRLSCVLFDMIYSDFMRGHIRNVRFLFFLKFSSELNPLIVLLGQQALSTSVITRNRIPSRAKRVQHSSKDRTTGFTSNGADHKIDCSFNPFLVKISISFLNRLKTYIQNQNPFNGKPRVKPFIIPCRFLWDIIFLRFHSMVNEKKTHPFT